MNIMILMSRNRPGQLPFDLLPKQLNKLRGPTGRHGPVFTTGMTSLGSLEGNTSRVVVVAVAQTSLSLRCSSTDQVESMSMELNGICIRWDCAGRGKRAFIHHSLSIVELSVKLVVR
jgi:hypothetical protein